MPYVKNPPWQDLPSTATPITAAALDRMEDGIEAAMQQAENPVLSNGVSLLGNTPDGHDVTGNVSLIQMSQWGIVDIGSPTVPTNITSKVRPTVQLEGQTGETAEQAAFLSDLPGGIEGLLPPGGAAGEFLGHDGQWGTPVNTSYMLMSETAGVAGTDTTPRVINAATLAAIIDARVQAILDTTEGV